MFPQLPGAVRIVLRTRPTDLRKGFDGLLDCEREEHALDILRDDLASTRQMLDAVTEQNLVVTQTIIGALRRSKP